MQNISTTLSLNYNKKNKFQETIWSYYQLYGRSFLWRELHDPYYIVVSEIMLQQTQTQRVINKFEQFIGAFGTFKDLADAPLRDVLGVWQGLGYSRRAIALQKIAQKITYDFNGIVPNDPEILVTFPGIGPATASSICAFAFNRPTVFVETNIRAVYIHFFFPGQDKVHDKELMPLIEQTLARDNSRAWYYALMDYGVMLKKQFKNPSRKSIHHAKQSRFEGSDRQIRGMILRILTDIKHITYQELCTKIDRDTVRIKKALDQLCDEGFIVNKYEQFFIA